MNTAWSMELPLFRYNQRALYFSLDCDIISRDIAKQSRLIERGVDKGGSGVLTGQLAIWRGPVTPAASVAFAKSCHPGSAGVRFGY